MITKPERFIRVVFCEYSSDTENYTTYWMLLGDGYWYLIDEDSFSYLQDYAPYMIYPGDEESEFEVRYVIGAPTANEPTVQDGYAMEDWENSLIDVSWENKIEEDEDWDNFT